MRIYFGIHAKKFYVLFSQVPLSSVCSLTISQFRVSSTVLRSFLQTTYLEKFNYEAQYCLHNYSFHVLRRGARGPSKHCRSCVLVYIDLWCKSRCKFQNQITVRTGICISPTIFPYQRSGTKFRLSSWNRFFTVPSQVSKSFALFQIECLVTDAGHYKTP